MPSFPRYESKGQLTTQTPSVSAPADTEGQVTEQAGKVVATATDDAVKLANAWDTVQKTTATANFKTGMLDILQRAQNDPDYNNSDQYFKEIEKLKTDNLRGFVSKTAETETVLNFGYEANVAKIKIENLYKKKMIDVGQASTLKLIDAEVNNPNENSLGNIHTLLYGADGTNEKPMPGSQVGDGLIDRKDAYKLIQDSEQKLKYNSFLQDFRANPVDAEKQFNKNSYGMDIETAEKARSKLKELKTIQREQEGNLYSDMSLRLTTGQLPEDEIDAAIALNKANPNEGITEAHGKQLKSAMYRDITKRIGNKEFKKHREAIDFVFSSSAQDRIKGYEAILAAYTDGLTPDETKFLKQILDTKKDVVFANKAAAGKKFLEQILGARPKNVQRETQSLLSYAKKIAGGSSPEAAAQAVAVDIIQEDHPATVGDPDLVGAFTPSKGFKSIPKVKSESSAGRQKPNS